MSPPAFSGRNESRATFKLAPRCAAGTRRGRRRYLFNAMVGRNEFPSDNGILRSCAAARGADIAARCPYHAKQIRPPQKLFLPVTDGFKQSLGDLGQRELIPETFFAIDADEINFLLRVNPRRNLVRQRFASRNFHARDDTE